MVNYILSTVEVRHKGDCRKKENLTKLLQKVIEEVGKMGKNATILDLIFRLDDDQTGEVTIYNEPVEF